MGQAVIRLLRAVGARRDALLVAPLPERAREVLVAGRHEAARALERALSSGVRVRAHGGAGRVAVRDARRRERARGHGRPDVIAILHNSHRVPARVIRRPSCRHRRPLASNDVEVVHEKLRYRRRVDVDDHRGGGLQLLQRAGKSLDADNVRVPRLVALRHVTVVLLAQFAQRLGFLRRHHRDDGLVERARIADLHAQVARHIAVEL